jgi:hypothetical protein
LLIPIVLRVRPNQQINKSTNQQIDNHAGPPHRPALVHRRRAVSARSCERTETPVAATPAPTRAAPVPLAEIATRSDDLAVYLKQVATRVAPDSSMRRSPSN